MRISTQSETNENIRIKEEIENKIKEKLKVSKNLGENIRIIKFYLKQAENLNNLEKIKIIQSLLEKEFLKLKPVLEMPQHTPIETKEKIYALIHLGFTPSEFQEILQKYAFVINISHKAEEHIAKFSNNDKSIVEEIKLHLQKYGDFENPIEIGNDGRKTATSNGFKIIYKQTKNHFVEILDIIKDNFYTKKIYI